ncbi:MAG: hypothetical protein ACI4PL_02075 [Faecousia sp.]
MNQKKDIQSDSSRNYELKSDAVEALAGADSQQIPEYSKEELNKYRSHRRIDIPDLVKILLVKAWFAGAVCFFFLWGLGNYVPNMIDLLFITAIVLGMVTDILTNGAIRFMEKTPGSNDDWMLLPKKGMVSFFLNILYAFLIIFCVYELYVCINTTINSITGSTDAVPLGVEPILFGLFCMGFDMLFVGLKRLLKTILADAKRSAKK